MMMKNIKQLMPILLFILTYYFIKLNFIIVALIINQCNFITDDLICSNGYLAEKYNDYSKCIPTHPFKIR